jgi:Flp pilus assembly protein TadB
VAQTKRKRRTKHRGTAAGTIETRGRTGRKPRADERGGDKRTQAAARREERLDKPPTWRASFNRALIATAIFLLAAIFILHVKPVAGVPLMIFVLVLYTLFGYATDGYLYRRRQRNKGARR